MKIKEPVYVIADKPDGNRDINPSGIRAWLKENKDEKSLAWAFSYVSTETGLLMHEVDDPDNDDAAIQKFEECLEEWWALEQELVSEIVRILENESTGREKTNEAVNGYRYIVKPFMERNGYRDGNGWWIKE